MSSTRTGRRGASLPPPPSPQGPAAIWAAVVDSWKAQPASLRLLRAFLGVTFVYAGIQKLIDPNFLHGGSPDFIGSQLRAFAQATPIGGLMRALDAAPVLTGVAIAVTEIAIGLGTLANIAPVLLALGGFLVNLTLTLSATWHVHPYFLGSDSIYAVAWLAYGLGVLETKRRQRRAAVGRKGRSAHAQAGLSRREFVRGAALGAATVATAGVAASLAAGPTVAGAAARASGGRASGGGAPATVEGPGPSTGGAQAGSAALSSGGTAIADLSQIPVGGAIGFQAPGVGSAALVRLGKDQVVAYSRVCTHAGCLVGYDPSSRLLVCPCHGAEYDPARDAAVVAGPAPSPLAPVNVAVDPSTGKVILPG
jgi:thiosulfate dehydrogenase (quinone) large subunit